MGAATFGELLDIADAHLLEVTGLLRTPNIGNEEHPATTVALWELTGVLARYTDRISTSFGLRKNGAAPARRTARLCTNKLRATRDLIGLPPSKTGRPPNIAQSLQAASQALGGGLDLLSAHFTVSPRGMTSRAVGACDRAAGTAVLHQLNDKPLRIRAAEGTRTREAAGHSPLINAYGKVQLYGLHTKTAFSTALAALDVPASAAAFHLADVDFPTPITTALHSTKTGAGPSRASQSPTTRSRTA